MKQLDLLPQAWVVQQLIDVAQATLLLLEHVEVSCDAIKWHDSEITTWHRDDVVKLRTTLQEAVEQFKDTTVATSWHVDDVQAIDGGISVEDARAVLSCFNRKYDCESDHDQLGIWVGMYDQGETEC